MSDQQSDNPISDAIRSIDQHESMQEIQRALAQARQRLKSIPDDGKPVDRARALLDAYQRAFSTDTESAFGGIIAFNQELDAATAST